jgi:hypothetical protein
MHGIRPFIRKQLAAVRVDLDRGHSLRARPLEAQIKPAYSGEQ